MVHTPGEGIILKKRLDALEDVITRQNDEIKAYKRQVENFTLVLTTLELSQAQLRAAHVALQKDGKKNAKLLTFIKRQLADNAKVAGDEPLGQ